MRITEHPILDFAVGRKVSFYFEGEEMWGHEGEPIAAALQAAGVKILSYTEKLKRPRGFFCAIGNCSACLMRVDGRPNVRTCLEPLREGMRVELQRGRGDLSAGI
ncbi:MAG: (2Fe-2S)-binding protein [Bacillota bacterium]